MCVSTKPEQTTRPPPFISSLAAPPSLGPTAAIRPSLTPTSVVGWSGLLSGSRTSRTTRSKSITVPVISPSARMLPQAAWHLQPDGQDAPWRERTHVPCATRKGGYHWCWRNRLHKRHDQER